MNRRKLIKGAASIIATVPVGCFTPEPGTDSRENGEYDTPNPNRTPGTYGIGESALYGGLEMVVTDTGVFTEIIIGDESDAGREHIIITPEENSVFALAYIRITNVSEKELTVPDRTDDVSLVSKDVEADNVLINGPLIGFPSEKNQVYRSTLEEQNSDSQVYPNTVVNGWAAFELPEEFERSNTYINIQCTGISCENRSLRWWFE